MRTRTTTRRNPEHPHNQMHAVGHKAKVMARSMSNAELDEYITSHIAEGADLESALALPRNRKIKMIKFGAMRGFADAFNKTIADSAEKTAPEEAEAKE